MVSRTDDETLPVAVADVPARPSARERVASRAAKVSKANRPMLLGEIAVIVALVFLYDRVRDVATTRAAMAYQDARWLLDVEARLHLNFEGPLNRWLSAHWDVQWLASWYYQLMHLSVTLVVLVWLYVQRPQSYRTARNALIAVNVLGLVVFWLRPVAPPRLLPGFVDSGLVTGVAEHATHVAPNVYAAMPSLHVGWAVWVVLQVWAAGAARWMKALVALHVVLTVVVVLATANHYLLDVVAGVAVATLAAYLVRTPLPARSHQRPQLTT